MSRWAPCKRREFVRRLKALGFEGPFSGGRHQFMVWQGHRLAVPSNEEYSIQQLRVLVREVEAVLGREVDLDEWSGL